ncbi:hypothetical protein AC249_AIPGENE25377 [Exaiptasia diaphana]|nr:hypothetical protein AC249_AIPGENE25377 [Exaiptasia diaphana]
MSMGESTSFDMTHEESSKNHQAGIATNERQRKVHQALLYRRTRRFILVLQRVLVKAYSQPNHLLPETKTKSTSPRNDMTKSG